jgi:hypothetical protein
MMKKVCVIALSLMIVSVATASVSFSARANYFGYCWPGNIVKIDLKSTEAMTGGFMIGVLSDFGAGGSISNYTLPPSGNPGFTMLSSGELLNTPANTSKEATSALLYGLAAYANSIIPAGTVLMSFDYVVPMGPFYSINIGVLPAGTMYMYSDGEAYPADASMANVMVGGVPTDVPIEGLQLVVVPEPMTFGLLSLGGLFLRRRIARS